MLKQRLLLVCLIMVLVAYGLSMYTIGHADGYHAGMTDGSVQGYQQGRRDGYNVGYGSGATDGYNNGTRAIECWVLHYHPTVYALWFNGAFADASCAE